MEIEIEGKRYTGDVVDLPAQRIDRVALLAAIRGRPSPYDADCPAPGPVHERAGLVEPGMGLKPRTALAAAARSRGIETPHDDLIDRLAEELDELGRRIDASRLDGETLDADGTEIGRAGIPEGPPPSDVDRLRERAAELRGQVAALERIGADPTDARAQLRETAARLSELETRRVAAEQTAERLRERRTRRERRLRLEDRLANACRDARATLVDRVRDEYAGAVRQLRDTQLHDTKRYDEGLHDESTSPDGFPDDVDPFAVPAPVAALAVLRVAAVRAPVVLALAVDRVGTPGRAHDWLDAPVLCL